MSTTEPNKTTNLKSPKGNFGVTRIFLKLISWIFQPLLMPTFGMMLIINMDLFSMYPPLWRWIALVGTFFFTGLLPALPILLMLRRGEVHDLFISKREQRTMPYLFSFLAYVFWAVFMWRTLQLPMFIVGMGIASSLSIIIIVFINMKWKISAHTSGIGGLTAAVLGVCYRTGINPVWLFIVLISISALVALSRIELKAHTPAQALMGYLLGFVLVLSAALLF